MHIMIYIYNTYTREKEAFQPIHPDQVLMYVCGPTVYNYIHIGNARSAVAFDTIRRYLIYRGYNVQYVSNFTDVDDKIIQAAKKAKVAPEMLTERFIEAFKEDTQALNVLPATCSPKATEHIPDIIQFIQTLIDQGMAYEVQGNVFYRTQKFEDYGQLSDQSLEELRIGASQRTGAEIALKEDPLDFALWKAAEEDQDLLAWNSPWGLGRPGWHIECSVMAMKHLGQTIDIHGGGQDLTFPHHENEIAQSEAKTGKQFVRYWMHNGYVTVGEQDEKMSKSLGNFVTVHELIQKIDPQVLRFFMTTTHYRKPLRFTQTALDEATTNWEKINRAYQHLLFYIHQHQEAPQGDDPNFEEHMDRYKDQFIQAMNDDFNTANAITVVYDSLKWMNDQLMQQTWSQDQARVMQQHLLDWMDVFGLTLEEHTHELPKEAVALIQQREVARKNKDFKTSDALRDQLFDMYRIRVEDTKEGTRWTVEK